MTYSTERNCRPKRKCPPERNPRQWFPFVVCGEADRRPKALQVLSCDRLGDKVGRVVLAFRVSDRDLTILIMHEEQLEFDMVLSCRGPGASEAGLGCLCVPLRALWDPFLRSSAQRTASR